MPNARPAAGLAIDGAGRGGGLAGAYRAILEKLTLRVAAKTFYRNLTQTVASVTRARRVIFLELSDGYLKGVSDAFGFGASDVSNVVLSCVAGDEMDGMESAVFEGRGVIRLRQDANGLARELMEKLGANEIAAMGWRWEERPLGLVVACDTDEDGGFTAAHLSMLQAAGMGASIAWDHRRTVDALEEERSRMESSALTEASRATLEQDIKLDLLSLTASEIRTAVTSLGARVPGVPKQLDDLDVMLAEFRSSAQRDVPLTLIHEHVVLDQLVNEVCEPFRGVLNARCTIVEDIPSGIEMWVDRRAVSTMLATLITGLVRNCADGSEIEVRARLAGDEVHLGLTTPCQKKNEGILSLEPAFERCRLLARMHSGELAVYDDPSSDLAFVLTLPLSSAAADAGGIEDIFEVGTRSQIRVHEEFHTMERDGRRVRLSFNEWRLFYFMWRHPNTVFTIEELAVGAWNDSSKAVGQRIGVTISRIRLKIERDCKRPNLLRTVRGKGYELALRKVDRTV